MARWRQHDGVAADAYATGQSLYVLAKAGALAPADPAYQRRACNYLLATQNANGSWRVTSRAPKFQAYFNSGFPYARRPVDQRLGDRLGHHGARASGPCGPMNR